MNRSISLICFFLLSVISFLFFYKYGIRLYSLAPLLFIPYVAILYFYTIRLKGKALSESYSKTLIWVANVVLVGGSVLLFNYFSVDHLDVDRWSVITHYWDAYFRGENPYSSRSHMGNYYGSYPFYFILQLPFYFVKEIGWAPIFAFILFQWYIWSVFRSYQTSMLAFVLSTAFLSIPYEIVTRSTIFANSVYILITAHFFVRAWKSSKLSLVAIASFLTGLMVCTRPIYGLVFLIAAIPLIRNRFSLDAFLTAGICSLAGLFLPFLHLYVEFSDSIMTYNPVTFMTTHFVPTSFYPIYLAVAVFLGYRLKEMRLLDYSIGLFLFFVVFCYAARYIVLKGWNEAIFAHFIDISYFFMAAPFLIAALCQNISSDKTYQEVASVSNGE